MSTSLEDMKGGESVCCGAALYNDDICSDCQEHSESIQYDCDICQDEGVVEKIEWTGTDTFYTVEIKCKCQEK